MVTTIPRVLLGGLLLLSLGCTRPSRKANAASRPNQQTPTVQVSTSGQPKTFMLPAGTRFSVRLAKSLSTDSSPTGSKVEGELAAPISAFAETIAPRGAKVYAEVGDSGGDGITLRATKIELKGGKSYEIASDEPQLRAQKIPAESLVGFRLRNPVQVTVE